MKSYKWQGEYVKTEFGVKPRFDRNKVYRLNNVKHKFIQKINKN